MYVLAWFLKMPKPGRRYSFVRKPWKSTFSNTPLSFDVTSPVTSLSEYPNKSYNARTYTLDSRVIFVADTDSRPICLSLFIFFVVGSERRMCFEFETECIMVLQGHPRSLILAPIWKRVCDFILVINSNFGPILPHFRDICRFSAQKSDHTPIPPEFWGVPFGLDSVDCRCCGSEERKS